MEKMQEYMNVSEEKWNPNNSGKNFESFLEAIQKASEQLPDTTSQILSFLERKILSCKRISSFTSLNIIETITNYLLNMNPEKEQEEKAVAVLLAIGIHSPKMVISIFLDQINTQSQPLPSLLRTVAKLLHYQGVASYLGATWNCVLRLLRKASTEEEKLGLCNLINALAVSVLKHIDLGSDEETMGIKKELVSFKACLTIRVLFNRWSLNTTDKVTESTLSILGDLFFLISPPKLKCQVCWLIRRLLNLSKAGVKPFYITQCLCQLLEAVAASGSGGKNLESKLDDLVVLLSWQVTLKVVDTDSQSVQNQKMALKSFHMMTRLYHQQMAKLFLKSMECKDEQKVITTLNIFRDVFQEVPQTMELKNDVMQTTLNLIKEDSKVVRLPLLHFIEKLGVCNYFTLQQGDIIINHLINLSQIGSTTVDEETRDLSINILHLVSLPKLIYLLCQPMTPMAFVPLCKTATDIAMKAQTMGQPPYLSSYHLNPINNPSPQLIFANLLLSSLMPYKAKEFGKISLLLLYVLHPLSSLHPVIHYKLGQVWMRNIPYMIQILEKHTEEEFVQENWEKRLLLFSHNTMVAIDDDSWMKELIKVVFEKIKSFTWLQQKNEKFFLYRLVGYILKTSEDYNFVYTILYDILYITQEEELESQGIGDAIGIVATSHLQTVLNVLQDYSSILTNKKTSLLLKLSKELRHKEWLKACNTIYIAYSRILKEIKLDIGPQGDLILSLTINHYQNCIIEKNKDLKLNYLNYLVKLTSILANLDHLGFLFSYKVKMIYFMMEMMKQEPTTSISSSVRQKAMIIISNLRKLHPALTLEDRKELLRVSFKSIVGLPPLEVMQADVPLKESQSVATLFRDTLQVLRKMLQGLVMDMPTWVQNYVEFLEIWLSSQKDHERERALWCGVRILSFTAQMHNFDIDIEFSRLGRLVRLLAILCQDSVDNISFLASQALYSLYCIMLQKKKLNQLKEEVREDHPKKEGVYSPSVFHNNTSEIAKAFAEYFNPKELSSLVLAAMEGLTDNRAKISLASGKLVSALLEERGKDMLKVDQIVDSIYDKLKFQLEPATRMELLQAICSLAGNNTCNVMPMLLKRPLPWEKAPPHGSGASSGSIAIRSHNLCIPGSCRINMELWRVFGTKRKTTINVLQMLLSILEERRYKQSYQEISFRHVAVTCALCEMLSGTESRLAVLEFCPRLLLAILNHLYWVIEQNVPQNMVVYCKEDIRGTKTMILDPVSCALEAIKTMLIAAEYYDVVSYADQHRGWDLLSSPKYYYMGIIELTSNPWTPVSHPSGIVRNCDSSILHRVMDHVKPLLYSMDDRQKVMARALFVQLLWHQSVALTFGESFLSHLIKWIHEPNVIMQEIGLRGISNLVLHHGQESTLASLLPIIQSFLKEEELVAVQAVKGLRNIICYTRGNERDQVRISATSALSHMLHQVFKFRPRSKTRKELYSFLVPLLISIQDANIEVAKVCGRALTEWAQGFGWMSLEPAFQNPILIDHVRILEETCKCLVGTGHSLLVGKLLFQSFDFLQSPRPTLRAAAITFIGQTVMKLNMNQLYEEDVQLLLNTLQDLKDDPVESIQGLASITIKKMKTAYVKSSMSSNLQMKHTFIKIPSFGNKKRLFKNIQSSDKVKKNTSKCTKFCHWKISNIWHSSDDSTRERDHQRKTLQFPRRILPQKNETRSFEKDPEKKSLVSQDNASLEK
ncbi:maestro heat-like repeat-containing protein family member 1 isoform X3 [Monodelphis domestica]|uniref:maestro heat-like repeat-containing protein family member 1 isoform X3 n=1 Tax=Monodelphis domestica TaxID=13616 RepID=UPI0024E1C680|nr:maestro heat-like repeat-containing protein family member 1 isoform X3 [Monodelphis domestica]